MHIASLVKIPCYLLKLSSENENMGVSRADNSVKIWQNLPISNSIPDLLNVNTYSKFGENPLLFTQVIVWNENMGVSRADNSGKKFDEICPLAIPNQISLMSMHTASLVKIPCNLLKLPSGNENMGMSRADNSVKIWRNLPISNPKPDLQNINAHTKFCVNPLTFTQVIIRKWKTDGRTYVRRMDGQTHGRPTWNHNTLPL